MKQMGAVGASLGAFPWVARQALAETDAGGKTLHVATNVYPWFALLRRENRGFHENIKASMDDIAASGVDGFEPIIDTNKSLEILKPHLDRGKLAMRSFYVNSTLHEKAKVSTSIDQVVALAKRANILFDTQIVVVNPTPIRWGGDENKTDADLLVQAAALNELGSRLKAFGMRLAYHNHDAEMRKAAREFHHMMLGTDPKNVHLCLDAHWIYRGAGNSSVALFDIIKHYGPRIVELHLRQSQKGTWTETFCDGDIDYRRIVKYLNEKNLKPLVVLEQAIEKGTPNTMTAVEAHKKSLAYAKDVFASLA